MLNDQITKKLQKVLNPQKFRFIILLYESSVDIETVKSYVLNLYPNSPHITLNLENHTYSQISDELYETIDGFVYIDDFSYLLESKMLYSGFNQRRDKIASHNINLICFYPKALQSKLYQTVSNVIPDLWEFRTAVIELENHGIKMEIPMESAHSFSSLGGVTFKEKQVEIIRLEDLLQNTTSEELKINLLDQMATLSSELNQYQKALEYYENALQICEEVFGENHIETAVIYSNLGSLFQSMGKYDKALSFFEKAIKIEENVVGENHLNTATSYNNLGSLYQDVEEYEKALPLFEKALKIQQELIGENHFDTAGSYNNIGMIYKQQKEYQKSLQYFEKALHVHKQVLSDNHPITAIVYNNIGGLYQSMGDHKKALPLLEKALKIREEMLGSDHPDTALTYYNLAGVYFELKECQKARILVEKAIYSSEQLNFFHPDIIRFKSLLKDIQISIHKQQKGGYKKKDKYCIDM